jgi:hypothetical protein
VITHFQGQWRNTEDFWIKGGKDIVVRGGVVKEQFQSLRRLLRGAMPAFKELAELGIVICACNPCYSGGYRRRIANSRPT